MNEEIRLKNKKEDKNKLIIYVVILVCCFFGGGVIGAAIGFGERTGFLHNIAQGLSNLLLSVSLYANLVMAVIVAVLVIILYKRCRALFKVWNPDEDEEDNDTLYQMNQLSNTILLITVIAQTLLLAFMALGFIQMFQMDSTAYTMRTGMICFWVGLIACGIVVIVSQQKVVNFTKELNPEKQGSVFDRKFQKVWLESCDEAEKKAVYESSFTSYKATNTACMLMWFFCIAGIIVFDFGVAPVFIVTVIWLTSAVSYCIKAMMLEKNNKRESSR